MSKTYIAAAAKSVDNRGCMQHCLDLEAQIIRADLDIHHLYIEPLAKDWDEPSLPDHFKSGCAPVEALARAVELIGQGAHAVLISGEDNIKTGYSRQERLRRMNIYAEDYPLTQAYTDLAQQFIKHHDIDVELFKSISASLFENHKQSYRHTLSDGFSESLLPEQKWYSPITELFRGVDCANPLVDFSGRVLLVSETLAQTLSAKLVEVSGIGLSVLEGDGPQYIDQIVDYQHLKTAYRECCEQAGIDFAREFRQGRALLETYTCYPVVPMGFLLASSLVDVLEEIPGFLQQHLITVTGGMNLARAPWNNPALNGIITLYERLSPKQESIAMVHANGGLGYRQGVALLKCL